MGRTVRSKGQEILIRGANGRRLRITREWMSVSDLDYERLVPQAGNLIDIKPGALEAARAPAPIPADEPSAGETAEAEAETPEPPRPSGPGPKKKSRAERKRFAQGSDDSKRGDAQ